MQPSIYRRRLGAAIAAGLALAAGAAFASEAVEPAKLSVLTERFAVAGQITPGQIAGLKQRGYTAIIALRPDGEAPDQTSAAQMEQAVRGQGLGFAYVPVAPGPIPEAAVAALGEALAAYGGKVLLYCRSGSRAARTWSLLEASRSAGLEADAILAAVKASGHSAEDLRPAIAGRIAARPGPALRD